MTRRDVVPGRALATLLASATAAPRRRRPRRRRAAVSHGRRRRRLHRGRHGPRARVLHRRPAVREGVRPSRSPAAPTSSSPASSAPAAASSRCGSGDEKIELTEFLAPRGRPIPPDVRANDRIFQHIAIIVSDMAGPTAAAASRRRARLDRAAAPPGLEPECRRHQRVLFPRSRRPLLEILSFPPARAPRKWHRRATVCSSASTTRRSSSDDTERSLRFYRDTLGLTVAGEERELRPRAGASEQRVRCPASNYGASRRSRARHRTARISGASRRPARPGRSPRERHRALADDSGAGSAGFAREPRPRPSAVAGLARDR